MITGLSGSGKSHIVDRFCAREPFQPFVDDAGKGVITPLVYVQAPSPCTLINIGREIYRQLTGQVLRSSLREHDIWERVRAQLRGQAVPVLVVDEMHFRHAGTGELPNDVGLSEASRRLQASISSVCRKLADGEIKRVKRREAPMVVGQVLIDLEEAKAILRPKRQQGVTVAEAAGILSVKWAVASALSKAGLFGCLSDGRHDERKVRSFQARHVKNADLAKELGILPRSLLEIASRHSIVPVIAPPACRQAFYSRDDAQVLRSTLIGRQNRKSAARLTQIGHSRRHGRTSLAKRTFPLKRPGPRSAMQTDVRHARQQSRWPNEPRRKRPGIAGILAF